MELAGLALLYIAFAVGQGVVYVVARRSRRSVSVSPLRESRCARTKAQ